jgi:pimeloyl-ACP methyl ester carboxylesterase
MKNLRILVIAASFVAASMHAFQEPEIVTEIVNISAQAQSEALVAKKTDQISYEYKTELVLGDKPGVPLPDAVESYAKSLYSDLNKSPMFKTTFVRDIPLMREFHLDPSNPDRGQLVSVTTEDGIEIKCTYFDRGSDELVVVGPGFTNEREIMSPFVEMFRTGSAGKKGRDVVIMDFRGHGYEPTKLSDPSTWLSCDLAKNTFGMDSRESMLGEVEELDVVAVVKGFRNFKNYKNVCGVSVCYGSFVFLKTEAMYPGLFDKVVVDGCWDTLEKLVGKMRHDLKLLCKPQTGGWKEAWLSKQGWAQESLFWCARNIWQLNFEHDVRLTDYLPKITKTPVLFFYGKNDLMVYRDEFEDLFNAVATPYKVGVVTSNPHVMNQYKQKELYKHICETFFDSPSVEIFSKELLNVPTSEAIELIS